MSTRIFMCSFVFSSRSGFSRYFVNSLLQRGQRVCGRGSAASAGWGGGYIPPVHKGLEGRLKLEPGQLAGDARVVGHDLGESSADLRALHDDAVGLELLPAVVALLVAHDDGVGGRLLVLGRLLDVIGILVDPGPVPVVVGRALVDVLGLADGPHGDLGLLLLLAVLAVVAILLVLVLVLLLAVLLVVIGVLLLGVRFLVLLVLLRLGRLRRLGVGLGGVEGGTGPAVRELPRLGGAPRVLLGAGAEGRPAARHCSGYK
jgi:hypothetical protein